MILQKNKIYNDNALPLLESFPNQCVNQCVTSPPYFRVRIYDATVKWNGWNGELGREQTVKMYIEHLMLIFNQVKRVLTKDGSCWVVISDSHRNKSLRLVPERFVIAMRSNGWNVIAKPIWHKGNAMPQGQMAKDSYTVDYENVYVFTKSQKYYWKTQYVPYAKSTLSQFGKIYKGKGRKNYEANKVQNPSDVKRRIIKSMPRFGGNKQAGGQNSTYSGKEWIPLPHGSLARTVWKINTKPSAIEHYAVYPEELVTKMIDAGCPQKGTVLDPFLGSGTTALTAMKMGRNFVGIEMNKEYCDIANDRIDFIKAILK